MMVLICDNCGTKNIGEPNFCIGCGVDLRESGEPGLEKKKDRKKRDEVKSRIDKNPKNQQKEKDLIEQFRIIKWCWLKTYDMPYVFIFISLLAQGKSRLGFCDCTICNQGYREFLAFKELLDGKKVSSHSRDIVKKARDQDMSKISWDLSDLLLNYSFFDDQETPRNKITTPVQKPVAGKGKILIEIDEDIIENAVVKILQSEKGQQIIQDSRAPGKRRTPDKS